jgi:SET domain-containing protein
MDHQADSRPSDKGACPSRERLRDRVYKGPSAIHGTGVFARASFAAGERIGSYTGPVAKRDGIDVLWLYQEGRAPVGRSGRNLLRYLNHGRPGNAEFRRFDLHALRPIAPGEEITFDYARAPSANDKSAP